MSENAIRVLMVAAIPAGREAIQGFVDSLGGNWEVGGRRLEVAGVAYNRRSAIQQFKSLEPELVLIDLMLPGMRSIEVVSFVTGTSPETKVLAMVPGDPPHDRILLAVQAGALGYISQDAEPADFAMALEKVLVGQTYLPKDETYEVLQLAASDLIVSRTEKRAQFLSSLIALVPAAGILAAFTSFLWREYWGQIGVRVGDLGVDASKRAVEFLISLLLLLGSFGPLFFINTWLDLVENHFEKVRENLRSKRLKGLLYRRKALWGAVAVIVLIVTVPLNYTGGEILTILIGVVFGAALLGNMAGFGHSMPSALALSRERIRWVTGIACVLLVVLMSALSVEVFLRGPDLRHDGVHGTLVRKVLDVSARPAMFYDLEGKREPLGALYLGGNADLYVIYDPNREVVLMIPVGSTRVELIDEVPRTGEQ